MIALQAFGFFVHLLVTYNTMFFTDNPYELSPQVLLDLTQALEAGDPGQQQVALIANATVFPNPNVDQPPCESRLHGLRKHGWLQGLTS